MLVFDTEEDKTLGFSFSVEGINTAELEFWFRLYFDTIPIEACPCCLVEVCPLSR